MSEEIKVEECFIAEKDNPYPLCTGRGEEKCKDCNLWIDWCDEKEY